MSRFLALGLSLAWAANAQASLGQIPSQRLSWALLVLLLYLLGCAALWWRRRARRQARQQAVDALLVGPAGVAPVLVLHASQTGQAEAWAWQTAQSLQAAGLPVRLLALAELDAATLAAASRALFLVSTTGEGDAPDNALRFLREVMARPAALGGLSYGLMALGDREYSRFCAFGRELDVWLRLHGAQPLFNAVEVDNAASDALDLWNLQLTQAFGVSGAVQVAPRPWQRLQLLARRELNPGSQGLPSYWIELGGPGLAGLHWQSGDILEVLPQNDPEQVAALLAQLPWPAATPVEQAGETRSLADWLARAQLADIDLAASSPQALLAALKPLGRREYSLASVPADGMLALLIRQTRTPIGALGLGSGWLSAWQALGGEVELRLRANPGFRLPDDGRPLILVGNGTGMAGLRGHLQSRVLAGRRRNWLVFGEREAEHDFYCRDEILAWQQQGFLPRLDLAFSRDSADHPYVQDRLRAAATELRAWVAEGAAIYVCGSLAGMAGGVDAVLRDVLGEVQLEQLAADKRYCRDVY